MVSILTLFADLKEETKRRTVYSEQPYDRRLAYRLEGSSCRHSSRGSSSERR
jgi:hypothetical protein